MTKLEKLALRLLIWSSGGTSNALEHKHPGLLLQLYKLRRASSAEGMDVGVARALGASWRNTCMLKRDNASAIALYFPGTCFAVTFILNRASHRKSSLSNCIRRLSFDLLTKWQQQHFGCSNNTGCGDIGTYRHTWHSMTIGKSSLYAILNDRLVADQEPLNHSSA